MPALVSAPGLAAECTAVSDPVVPAVGELQVAQSGLAAAGPAFTSLRALRDSAKLFRISPGPAVFVGAPGRALPALERGAPGELSGRGGAARPRNRTGRGRALR